MSASEQRKKIRRRSVALLVLVVLAAAAILMAAELGYDLRACLIASSALGLFAPVYAVATLIALRRDNARLRRDITIAQLRCGLASSSGKTDLSKSSRNQAKNTDHFGE